MAAYAATVTPAAQSVRKLPNGFGLIFGQCNITNYNQTLVEITGITKFFKAATLQVISEGVTSNGYCVKWDTAGKSFKSYATGAAAGNAMQQTANDVNIGSVSFVAFGMMS